MSKMTVEQAKDTRIEAIRIAKLSKEIRSDTRRKMDIVDKTCSVILERGRPFSVPEVARVMKERFPSEALSESSISNQTTSGDAYKEVISAWKNFATVVGSIKSIKMPATASDDISDLILSQLKPKEIIPTILAMRTSLRNARKQLQIHQMVSHSKVLDHETSIRNGAINLISGEKYTLQRVQNFTEADIEVLKAFLDPVELGASGLNWNEIGQLINDTGESISRPGLRDVISKVLGSTSSCPVQ